MGFEHLESCQETAEVQQQSANLTLAAGWW